MYMHVKYIGMSGMTFHQMYSYMEIQERQVIDAIVYALMYVGG